MSITVKFYKERRDYRNNRTWMEKVEIPTGKDTVAEAYAVALANGHNPYKLIEYKVTEYCRKKVVKMKSMRQICDQRRRINENYRDTDYRRVLCANSVASRFFSNVSVKLGADYLPFGYFYDTRLPLNVYAK